MQTTRRGEVWVGYFDGLGRFSAAFAQEWHFPSYAENTWGAISELRLVLGKPEPETDERCQRTWRRNTPSSNVSHAPPPAGITPYASSVCASKGPRCAPVRTSIR